MKYLCALLIAIFSLLQLSSFAQTDSSTAKPMLRANTHFDSLYLAKLNNSGNLMIAAGVGLCGAGSFLIYEGNKTYTASVDHNSPTAADDTQRNHKQGTIYYAFGGIGIAGGIILVALGARNKVDFKLQKRMMELKAGVLDNGNLGATLTF